MKTTCWYFVFCFCCFSCSEGQEPALPLDTGVEIVFSAKQSTATREGMEKVDLPSILIFREKGSLFSQLTDPVKETGWQEEEEKGKYGNSLILPSGNYRFLLASGFSKEEGAKDRVFFSSETKELESKYDKDYFFSYRQEEDGMLKTCGTDLLVDANSDQGFESNDKEYSLVAGNKFAVLRKITRLQARLDLLIRRGVKTDKGYDLIEEGVDNEDAMQNALRKIESIQVKVMDVSSRCHVDGLLFSTPKSYSFSLPDQHSVYAFKPFRIDDFKIDFDADFDAGNYYSKFEHSAYCTGPLLFPAPGKGEGTEATDSVDVQITIGYKEALRTKIMNQKLLLKRNQVSLMILWILEEEVGVGIEIPDSDLEYSDNTKGDDGFWN